MRPSGIWCIALLCLALLAGAMGWATDSLLRMERKQGAMLADAAAQERARLALWRMESVAAALVVEESARPPQHYRAFAEPDEAYTGAYRPVAKGGVVTPSPLLNGAPPRVKLHFELEPDGQVRSPEAPEGRERTLALERYAESAALDRCAVLLTELRGILTDPAEPASLAGLPAVPPVFSWGPALWDNRTVMACSPVPASRPVPDSARVAEYDPPQIAQGFGQGAGQEQQAWNTKEANLRNDLVENAKVSASSRRAPVSRAEAKPDPGFLPVPVATGPELADITDVRAFWLAGELFLTRRASAGGSGVIQGVWLDWPVLQRDLLATVSDLFPAAVLEPVPAGAADGVNQLASLPLRFVPGLLTFPEGVFWTPLKLSLATAWVCVLLAVCAVALVLRGMVALSERRASFVSSVTHELRTPLATFKLYSEMLADGMVRDPDKRQQYLETLTSEADRLGHLVENVLAYSRLEGGKSPDGMREVAGEVLCRQLAARLEQRVAAAGAAFTFSPVPLEGLTVRTDQSAVEQILGNLADNAAKYGHGPDEPARIVFAVSRERRRLVLAVRDAGPGISRGEARRLFRPFHKSAREAAHTAPGVGLGLALCRRLARELGGTLELENGTGAGACFVLRLPVN